jgi:hypothetical protein
MTDTDSGATGVANRWSISRYDLVLAVIPAALFWPAVFAHVLGIGPEFGLVVGAVVGGGALLDAVLLNPPRGPRAGGNGV